MENRITRSVEGDTITFASTDGGFKFSINAASLSPDIQRRAMIHGLIQTIGDAAALSYTQPDGSVKRPTMEEKFAEMQSRAAVLVEGQWSAVRESSGRASGETLFGLALQEVTGKTSDEVREFLTSLSKDEVKALRADPTVKHAFLQLQAARAQTVAPSAESPLARLLGGATPAAPKSAKKSKK
jgi:hypothetical protein